MSELLPLCVRLVARDPCTTVRVPGCLLEAAALRPPAIRVLPVGSTAFQARVQVVPGRPEARAGHSGQCR